MSTSLNSFLEQNNVFLQAETKFNDLLNSFDAQGQPGDIIAFVASSFIQTVASTAGSIFELVFRSQAVGGAILGLAYSAYTMTKALNPDLIDMENAITQSFDSISSRVYNEIVWILTPFIYYTLYNSLFLTGAQAQSYIGSTTQLMRSLPLQGLLCVFYYYFYKSTKNFGSLGQQVDNIILTLMFTGVPLGSLYGYLKFLQ
ncbi:UNKNOWN [Stylonychia lemnae]|uniref:Uncharacterized protein n=1 Tax=Stylonychia lemnae TaxID=5949 RepID=A0A078B4Z0_STYLE|nr:UNKNOWN [Stylonychia lemnae]|eukprot:CDW89595.1 UNKNOWN [Stylonychia lemnae]